MSTRDELANVIEAAHGGHYVMDHLEAPTGCHCGWKWPADLAEHAITGASKSSVRSVLMKRHHAELAADAVVAHLTKRDQVAKDYAATGGATYDAWSQRVYEVIPTAAIEVEDGDGEIVIRTGLTCSLDLEKWVSELPPKEMMD